MSWQVQKPGFIRKFAEMYGLDSEDTAMMKYPVGIQSFSEIIERGFVYVDKTDLIYKMVNGGKMYFLSRPRRFGKSLLVSTIENYFLGRRDLFRGLAMDSLENGWEEHPVFHLDFNSVNFTQAGELERKLNGFLASYESVYGKPDDDLGLGDRFVQLLRKAHRVTGRKCVVLIDEYDKPLLDVIDTGYTTPVNGERRPLEDWHREVLKGFYSVFKAADADLRFVLLTGVTKFSQVSVFSGFNQTRDISMSPEYEALCGITQEELERYFAEPVACLAGKEGVGTDEMLALLKRRYDGYHFSKEMRADIYNPFSILNTFDSMSLEDYWFASGTPTDLVRLMSRFGERINEIVSHRYSSPEFADYRADVERPLPMIYQSGYLTIKQYDRERNDFLLGFPNEEVERGFMVMLAAGYFDKEEVYSPRSTALDLVDAMKTGDAEGLRTILDSFLSGIPYSLREKAGGKLSERDFQYTIYLIFRLLSPYVVKVEQQTSHGRADCVVETPGYVYIFEFKLDGSADEALAQIEDCGYARPYASDARTVVRIGAVFSSSTCSVEEWKAVRYR